MRKLFVYTIPALMSGLLVAFLKGESVGSFYLPVILILLSVSMWKVSRSNTKKGLSLVIVSAISVRFLFLFFPESDDLYRYLWEGWIQHKGFNPFELAPDARELAHLRPWFHSLINHPNIPAIYWPFAQVIFKVFTLFSLSPVVLKLFLLLFDFGIIVILLLLLPKEKKSWIALYLFNPIVLFAVAGEGHLEIIPVFFTLAGYLFFTKEKHALSFLMLSLAVLVKVNFILFLPLIITKRSIRSSILFVVPFLMVIPYLTNSLSFSSVPVKFATEFAWNGPVFTLVASFLNTNITYVVILLFVVSAYVLLYLSASQRLHLFWGASAIFILCTPTLHYWYLLMITPFMVLKPSSFWITLHITIMGIGFYFHPSSEGVWINQTLLQVIAFVPPIVVGVIARSIKKGKTGKSNEGNTLSVVVPVYNEIERIADQVKLLQKIAPQAELIFVDGNSQDGTKEYLKNNDLTLLESNKGRGIQISEGVKFATGDIVVIMHADSVPSPTIFSRISSVMSNERFVGGSCGQCFSNKKKRFSLIQHLNTIRARWFGISFGDQLQFFRRSALVGQFPEYYLMEDVELSLRLKERGELVFLKNGLQVSSRRWQKRGYFKNVISVVTLLGEFLVKRQLGMIEDSCLSYYKRYYGNN